METLMSSLPHTKEEVVRRGREIYEREIRAKVEPEHAGEFVIVDVESGSYEIAADGITAARRIRERNHEAVLCFLRVGSPTAYRIGAPTSTGTFH
jgi:intein/homing endonuclease